MLVKDVTVEELQDDYNWEEVFGEGSGGNCDKTTDPCPPQSDIDPTPPMRSDVVEVIAAIDGENDGDDWIGVFLLKDGRYCVAIGGCDYTGWECQAGNSLQVAATLDDALTYGLTELQRERLGFDARTSD